MMMSPSMPGMGRPPKTHPNRDVPAPDELGGAEADRLRRTSHAIRVGGSIAMVAGLCQMVAAMSGIVHLSASAVNTCLLYTSPSPRDS